MTEALEDRIALIDMDGTIADYDEAMKAAMLTIQSPGEQLYTARLAEGTETPWLEARRKMIQRQTGFWRNLQTIPQGFEVVEAMREIGFLLHVLTKGPRTTPNAWGEKLSWCEEFIPDAACNISMDKSLVYGRVLFDDFPPYFEKWLKARPRGLVIALAHPWNEHVVHPSVIRHDGSPESLAKVREALLQAYNRKSGA